MPWTTPETFTAGQTLTAASMNVISGNARMGQPVFTNEAARDAAITAPEEGMTAYLTAPTVPAATGGITALPSGVVTIYDGSVWVCVTPVYAFTSNIGTTTSGTYTATLGGSPGTNPSVTLVTGTSAVIDLSCYLFTSAAATGAVMSVAVSGAGTVAASDNWWVLSAVANGIHTGRRAIITGLTAGANTFTLQYRMGGAATGTFGYRSLSVQGVA